MNKVVTKFLEWVSVLVRPIVRGALNRLHAKGLLKVKVSPCYDEQGEVSRYDVQLVYLAKETEILFDTTTSQN